MGWGLHAEEGLPGQGPAHAVLSWWQFGAGEMCHRLAPERSECEPKDLLVIALPFKPGIFFFFYYENFQTYRKDKRMYTVAPR